MSGEQQFQKVVEEIAKEKGWKTYHVPYEDGRRPPGFPDLVLVRDKVLFRELKTDTGELSASQRVWINQLRKAGANVEVWRPEDMEIIERQLENIEEREERLNEKERELEEWEDRLNEREEYLSENNNYDHLLE